jgi:hypothetical protein
MHKSAQPTTYLADGRSDEINELTARCLVRDVVEQLQQLGGVSRIAAAMYRGMPTCT